MERLKEKIKPRLKFCRFLSVAVETISTHECTKKTKCLSRRHNFTFFSIWNDFMNEFMHQK